MLGGGAGAPLAVAVAAGATDVWVAIEDDGGRKCGDLVCEDLNPPPVGHVVMGDKAIVTSVSWWRWLLCEEGESC